MAVGDALSLLLVVALDALRELLHQRVCHLRQPALGGPVGHVARGAAALDARAHGVEDVPLDARLLVHELDGHLGAVEDAEQVDVHHGRNGLRLEVHERTAAAIDAGVVDPVADGAELLLGKLAEHLDVLEAAHVALGAEYLGVVSNALFDGGHRRRRVLDVADDHRVSSLSELDCVRPADTRGTPSDHHPRLGRGRGHDERVPGRHARVCPHARHGPLHAQRGTAVRHDRGSQ
mmetsp:Transcript_6894/g.23531  ORF Transcript_6894/g.23531 Transcript_6894/m.23531 type:complete len:234 (-) Transcript_6894:37-738(-)